MLCCRSFTGLLVKMCLVRMPLWENVRAFQKEIHLGRRNQKEKRKRNRKEQGRLFKVSEDLNVPTVIDGSGTKCVNGSWTTAELTALVQHIYLYWDGAHTDKWPTMKNMKFWDECATFNKVCGVSRTGWLSNFIINL